MLHDISQNGLTEQDQPLENSAKTTTVAQDSTHVNKGSSNKTRLPTKKQLM